MEKEITYYKKPIWQEKGMVREADVNKVGIQIGPKTIRPAMQCMFRKPVPPGVFCKLRITGLNHNYVKSITAQYSIGNTTYQQLLNSNNPANTTDHAYWEPNNTVYVSQFKINHDAPDRHLEQGNIVTGLRFFVEFLDGHWPADNGTSIRFELYVDEHSYEQFFKDNLPPVVVHDVKDKNCILS